MGELHAISLTQHLDAILEEFESCKSIYNFPLDKMFLRQYDVDFSVDFQGSRVATPIGPAAGPHTQMAQNILLSYLGGSRILELKTVQVLDQLEIPRPCIDARNICFNVEWSQELRLEESAREYVRAWLLVHIIEEMELLGIPKGDAFYKAHFDLSVGYDLKGISSPQVTGWIKNMQNAQTLIRRELDALPPRYAHFKTLSVPSRISNSITLSTFHGCPAGEIEQIVEYLMQELDMDVIVKMNPTLLGFETVKSILHNQLSYQHLPLGRKPFDSDISFDQAIAMMKRLEKKAGTLGRVLGAKFTNTLVVGGGEHSTLAEAEQYLSGPPLHVLATQAMHQFRSSMGDHFPISFSAGIDARNIADALSLNMVPVTVCTDLLKKGGYTRQQKYFVALNDSFKQIGATSLQEFILLKAGKKTNIASAGMINTENYLRPLAQNPIYHFSNNTKPPKKTDTHLEFFDCLTCDICLPVCPNAANFHMPIPAGEYSTAKYVFKGTSLVRDGIVSLVLKKKGQIANIADFCNDCSNCDTFCPELGGPYKIKPKFFLSQSLFENSKNIDGMYMQGNTLCARFQGEMYGLDDQQDDRHIFSFPGGEIDFDESGNLLNFRPNQSKKLENPKLDIYLSLKVLKHSLQNSKNFGITLIHNQRKSESSNEK